MIAAFRLRSTAQRYFSLKRDFLPPEAFHDFAKIYVCPSCLESPQCALLAKKLQGNGRIQARLEIQFYLV
jgi:hypothetical protein